MKPIFLKVVESTTRPGMLSIRMDSNDPTATPFYKALTASGAKVGDTLVVQLLDDLVEIDRNEDE